MAIAIAEVFAAAAGGRWIWMEMEFLPAKLTLTSRFFCRFLIVSRYWSVLVLLKKQKLYVRSGFRAHDVMMYAHAHPLHCLHSL